MELRRNARCRALGFVSYPLYNLTTLHAFLVFFYAPVIASLLRAQGWSKPGALGVGLLVPIVWLVISWGILQTSPLRFAKLKEALGWILYGLPILGMFVIAFGQVAVALWHLAR